MDNILNESILFRCNDKQSLLNHYKTLNDRSFKSGMPKLQRVGSDLFNISGLFENVDTIMQLIRSKWFCVQNVILDETNSIPFAEITGSRLFINEAMRVIIHSVLIYPQNGKLKERTVKLLGVFSSSIVRLSKLKKSVILKIQNAKQSSCPYYIYFHTLIETYYYITALYCITEADITNLEKHMTSVFSNMLTVYEVSYKSNKCHCPQFFWLTMQLLTEKVDSYNNLFWRSFNMVFNKEDPLLSLRFLSELASIQGFNEDFEYVGSKSDRIKPNYQFLELKLKEFLSQANSDSLIICFKSLEPLLCDLWLKEGRIDIFQIVWDFYSKRLNVSSVNCENLSARRVIEDLDVVLLCPRECTDDFEFFVGLLLRHLHEYPVHWSKMKGRIYSQLGPNKIKDLTDIGIKHVIVLFLALSNMFEEMEKKILAFMENLPRERKFTKLVWNMYAAVILKFVRDSRSVDKICLSMACLLQEASTETRHFHLIKEFMTNLESIIARSSNMQLHQWQLFGRWLTKYLSSCYFVDLRHSVQTIDVLFEKCNNADSWPHWENFFREIVYSTLKQLAMNTSDTAVPLTGVLAGKIALCYNSLMDEAFKIFTSDAVSTKVAAGFLTIILHRYPDCVILSTQQENLILQRWVKICFLTLETQEELTRLVSKLDLLPERLKAQLSMTEEGDPVEGFITFLGANFGTDIQKDRDILKLCELAFNNIDTTLAQYLYKGTAATGEQVVIKIYKYISLICLKCGSLIYNRNKSVTILTKLVETLLLPMDFLIGKKVPNNSILCGVKVTWATFFKAFIQLNGNTKDPYLERTLKDMITKYLPFYPSTDSPIVKCLHDEQLNNVILGKMNLAYFQPPLKETDANLLKALKIIADVTSSSTTSCSLFKLVVDRTLFGLFEVVILHSQRNVALSVIKRIIASSYFIRTQTEFREAIVAVAKKHMALNTINCFQLMMFLAKSVPADIRYVLEDIRKQVANVERQRGVGFDKSLRQHLEKLESCLSNTSVN